ncbi:DUF885 family protein [Modestobacter versicolor]|uniref:DUF885 family protein n=1 Tax=Modestobacter versicolor TaxID=429133 RepID=UPI0034DF1B98
MSAWDDVQALGAEIWAWRRLQAPRSRDDIPRMERPPTWAPDFSRAAVAAARETRAGFAARLAAIDLAGADVPTRVDAALLGSALARVHWELDVLRSWQRDPSFWVDQTLGTVFDALVQPPPFDEDRVTALRTRLTAVPGAVATAREVLTGHAERELAGVAVAMLGDAGSRLTTAIGALPAPVAAELAEVAAVAGEALDGLTRWLTDTGPGMPAFRPVGREAFTAFLRQVALAPEPLDWMVAAGRTEFARAVTMEAVAAAAAADVPVPPLPASVADHVADEVRAEAEVRAWYAQRGLLRIPAELGAYTFVPRPPWLEPLVGLGVTDDLLGPSRVGQDPVAYAPDPAPDLPFFYRANMLDPRLGVAHEGVHAVQLAWSWTHPDPLRREYTDSLANEGLAFYDEEMLLDSGLWSDAPHSRVVVARFLRLRALRVEVDVRLATGELTIDGAARLLEERVPMDRETAQEEAAFFAGTPGQALTYLVGKLQIQSLLADLVAAQGDAFDLRAFHERLWLEGNVPLALQRWELLGTEPDLRG